MAIEYGKILLDGDIGINIQAASGALTDIADVGVVPGDSRFLVGTGAGTLAWETGTTVRTSIGLGAGDSPTFAGLGLGVAATAGTLVVRSLGASGENIFVVERSTSDLLVFNYINNGGIDSCALGLKRGGTTLIYLSTRNTDDSYFNMAGGLVIGGTDAKTKLTVEGTLTLKEQASADGDTAAYGQFWVKDDVPCVPMFTDDGGDDFQLGYGFGTWTDKDSGGSDALATGNVYKVSSDGFVTFYVDEDWTGNDWIRLYTDSNATPTTKRITLKDINLGALGEISGECPIKKNDYWKIDVTGLSAGNVTIYWLPIGTGACVKQV